MCSVEQWKGPQGTCFFLNTKSSETWHTPHHFDKLLPPKHSSNYALDNVHCHIHKIIITGCLPITTGTECIVSNKMSILPRSLFWETIDRNLMHWSPSHLLRFVRCAILRISLYLPPMLRHSDDLNIDEYNRVINFALTSALGCLGSWRGT